MSQEKISIIIAVYNDGDTLERAVTSALNSDYKNLEVIVVDDGSTDGGVDKIHYLKNNFENLTVVKQKNMGLPGARDSGIKNATGDFITFLDADDELSPQKIIKQMNALKGSREASIVFTGGKKISENDDMSLVCCIDHEGHYLNITDQYCKRSIRPPTASMMLFKKLYLELGGFNKNLKAGSEFEFFTRDIAGNIEFILVPEQLYLQYIRSDSLRNNGNGRDQGYKALLSLLEGLILKEKEKYTQKKLIKYVDGKMLEIWISSFNWNREVRTNIIKTMILTSYCPFKYKIIFILSYILPGKLLKIIRKNITFFSGLKYNY